MKKSIFVIFTLLCCACSACAADPMSLQSYFTGKTEATTIAPGTDYLPIVQGSLVKRVHPNTLFNDWKSVPYSAVNFVTNSPATWTVPIDSVSTYAYLLQKNTMTVSWSLWGSTVANNPSFLLIRIPESRTSKHLINIPCTAVVDGSMTSCIAKIQPDSSYIYISRGLYGTPTWANSTETYLFGQITFEVY